MGQAAPFCVEPKIAGGGIAAGEWGTSGCSPGWEQGPGLFLQGAGFPLPEKGSVAGTHALPSTGSMCEGTVVALLEYRTPQGHQPAIAGCRQCVQNRRGARHNQHQPCAWPVSPAGRTLGTSLLPRAMGVCSRLAARGWQRS